MVGIDIKMATKFYAPQYTPSNKMTTLCQY